MISQIQPQKIQIIKENNRQICLHCLRFGNGFSYVTPQNTNDKGKKKKDKLKTSISQRTASTK